MIPKRIHYCWFGEKEKPELVQKCIESWGRTMPDYEIVEWNESNFDKDMFEYTRQAYSKKQYSFVSDVARLFIIYNYGGIYLDTDVETIKRYDSFLGYEAFFGMESDGLINTGIGFGAKKKCKVVKKMLDSYTNIEFVVDGKCDLTPCPIRNSEIMTNEGFRLKNDLEKHGNVVVFPSDYFNPKIAYGHSIDITENTYSIHHYAGSWLNPQQIK